MRARTQAHPHPPLSRYCHRPACSSGGWVWGGVGAAPRQLVSRSPPSCNYIIGADLDCEKSQCSEFVLKCIRKLQSWNGGGRDTWETLRVALNKEIWWDHFSSRTMAHLRVTITYRKRNSQVTCLLGSTYGEISLLLVTNYSLILDPCKSNPDT